MLAKKEALVVIDGSIRDAADSYTDDSLRFVIDDINPKVGVISCVERAGFRKRVVPKAGIALSRAALYEAHESIYRFPPPVLRADLLKLVPDIVGIKLNPPELFAHDIP